MELPPMPKISDWNLLSFKEALASWERVCMAIIETQKKR